jgi:putative ABC transport system permease protein
MTPQTADRLHLPWYRTDAVLSSGPRAVTPEQEDALAEAVRAAHPEADAYTERGFRNELSVVLLILGAAGALAILVGTLSATGLALADARPDLATLAAVGAATRRSVAAGHALVIGLLGAAIGTAFGFLPGIAVTVPLTADNDNGPTVAIPWTLLLTVGLAVPVVAAVVAAVTHRSRLTLVRRLGQ